MKLDGGLAYLTASEMSEADRLAIDTYGLGVESLMENAGAKSAEVASRMLEGGVEGKRIKVLAGKGNNGGDGLVAARHLHNWGADVIVILGDERESLREAPGRQLATVEKIGITVQRPDGPLEGDLIVDALLGYGSQGDPRGSVAALIKDANSSKIPIIAVDIPSGLGATAGEIGDPCIAARATVTFGFPKTGFLHPRAKGYVGELYLADISLPSVIYERYGCPGTFSRGPIVRVW